MTGEIIPRGEPDLETALAENDGNIGKVAKQPGGASATLRKLVTLSPRLSATIDEVRAFCF
jgi:hypothetical protein